jgi:hypothetical protein
MTRSIQILALAIVAMATLSAVNAQQYTQQQRRPSMSQNIGANGYFPNQASARAAHPITQGGTTGGTVNPGLTRDHMQHGYNG